MEEKHNEQEQVSIERNPPKEDANGIPDDEHHVDGHHSDIRPFVSCREKIVLVLHSHKFQLCVIGLVIFDCLLVISEMLLDLHIEKPAAGASHNETLAIKARNHDTIFSAHILHYLSIAVLGLFLIELVFKIYAFQLEFFHHKLEIFDAVVVIISFTLDIVFLDSTSSEIGVGLLILLRLWRVARILNGVVLSVKSQAEHKLAKERRLRDVLEQERFQNQEYISSLEQDVKMLKSILQKHGIAVPSENPSQEM